MNTKQTSVRLPAEWETQSFVQLTWPHADSDWAAYLEEAEACFVQLARAILRYEALLVVCRDAEAVRCAIQASPDAPLRLVELPSNDTWARDHAGISVRYGDDCCVYDFAFNAWGNKFPWQADNALTAQLASLGCFGERRYVDCLDFVLEGGSLESDGAGTLLTAESCLLSAQRNGTDRLFIEAKLKDYFGLERVLWIKHSYLAGDDTDGHIDMLARFAAVDTIVYVAPKKEASPNDVQQESLLGLQAELRLLKQADGRPYRLIPLPFPDPVFYEGELLPASYANFLIVNHAVLVPIYGVSQDGKALRQLQEAFPDREIVPIDCRVLIRQHGSLHCSTMQF